MRPSISPPKKFYYLIVMQNDISILTNSAHWIIMEQMGGLYWFEDMIKELFIYMK
jgi:hypothetical protein